MNEVSAVLIAARKMIVTNGWVRGVYQGTCGYCAVGAVRAVDADWETELHVVHQLFECLPPASKNAAGPFTAVFDWNDNVADSIGDVLSLFDRAIQESQLRL